MEKPRVLLVDDEEELLSTMTLILEMEGYDVATAKNGDEAWNKLRENSALSREPQVLVTDIEMAGGSGLDLIDRLNRDGLQIPILVITGYGSKRTVVELLRKGVDDYLDKPFDMTEFVRRVENLTSSAPGRNPAPSADLEDPVPGMVQERFEMMGRLAAGIVHDVNNSLAAVTYCAVQLAERVGRLPAPDAEPARYNVDCLVKATQGARRTIRLFQAMARHEAPAFGPLDLHDVVQEALSLVRATVGRDAALLTDLSARHSRVHGDRVLLLNATVNLLINAYDAMPGGGGRIRVRTVDGCRGENLNGAPCITLSIRDTGEGLDNDVQGRLFTPSFTTKGDRGNGMGLASVRDSVNRHHGIIEMDSKTGEGSEFRIVLPVLMEV